MEMLFDQIITEEHPCVKASLGHWLFGYIHPYPDGNGRIARFLMNALLLFEEQIVITSDIRILNNLIKYVKGNKRFSRKKILI